MRLSAPTICVTIVTIVLTCGTAHAQPQCEVTSNPSEVELVTDDIRNFVTAMEAMPDADDTASVLQEQYFDKASPGLKEYLRSNEVTAAKFLGQITKKAEKYSSLAELADQLDAHADSIRGGLVNLKELIPSAAFIPVYFFVGIHGGMFGEPSEYGIMIGFSEPFPGPDAVKRILTHEFVHVQQALTVGLEEYQRVYSDKRSLLALAIREGTAEFLMHLSTGLWLKRDANAFLLEHEEELWKRFQKAMHDRDVGDWMWAEPNDPEQPRDVGYVLGARIVEAYYNRAADKQKAIQEILAVTDYRAFLEKSGYGNSPK